MEQDVKHGLKEPELLPQTKFRLIWIAYDLPEIASLDVFHRKPLEPTEVKKAENSRHTTVALNLFQGHGLSSERLRDVEVGRHFLPLQYEVWM